MWEPFFEDLVECTDIVGFNIKFDLHWLRVFGDEFAREFQKKRIWDCQLGEYILSRQRWRYPSLDEAMRRRSGPPKIDKIKLEYWDKGINTFDIPRNELTEYAKQDILSTEWLFREQVQDFAKLPGMYRVFLLQCADLKVLEEMEANGLKFSPELCQTEQERLKNQLGELEEFLKPFACGYPVNWDSGDDLSTIMFGGAIETEALESAGVFKTGPKAGLPKFKKVVYQNPIVGLFVPDPSWEVAKTKKKTDAELEESKRFRIYATNDDVLSKIKDKSGFVSALKERAGVVKLLEFYEKLLTLPAKKGWNRDMLHGQFNQVVTGTGRCSSSDPNLQNFAGAMMHVFVTRYGMS